MKKYPHGLTLNAVCAAIDDYQRHEDSVPEEGILAAFNTLLGHSDIAEAFRSLEQEVKHQLNVTTLISKQHNRTVVERDDWKQRAEAAEEKLEVMCDSQYIAGLQAGFVLGDRGDSKTLMSAVEAYRKQIIESKKSAPAISLAELVPDENRNCPKQGSHEWVHHVPCYKDEYEECNKCGQRRNIEEAK